MGADEIVLFDYFISSSDEAAVAEATVAIRHADPYVEGSGIEPFTQMALLEAILAGRTEEDRADEARPLVLYADPATGAAVIIQVRTQLVEALAKASEVELVNVATVGSSRIGEVVGGVALRQFLGELAALARLVQEGYGRLYCFVYR